MTLKQNASMALIAAIVLSGCGGGGGGSNGGSSSAPTGSGTAVTPAPAPAPSVPAPAVPPVTTPDIPPPAGTVLEPAVPPVTVPPAPVPVSETIPSLAAPQTGSIAAIGSTGEGLWVSTASTKGLVFVDNQERHLGYQEGQPGHVTITWDGTWTFTGSNWAFATGGYFSTEQSVRMSFPLAGNGTFNTRKSFTGAFGTGSALSDPMAYEYSIANALAVKPADLVGSWSNDRQTLTIAANGNVTGRIANAEIGTCIVSGRIVPISPGTAKNMFNLTLTGTAAENWYCDMEGTHEHTFKAAITFANTGQNGTSFYRRALTFFGTVYGGWATGELLKD